MAEVLDYSSGFPAPSAVLAQYVGIVRYIGTPGRPKNLTPSEAQQMLAAGVPIALVYEEGAGWMLGGYQAGAAAARRALDDAQTCGVGVRCVYFACDVDVTTDEQIRAVEDCLLGAISVLGRDRVGVYGEADVIDACLSQRYATWGWQTRAWSGGRISPRAHLLQQIGYVYPGGVQADRSTVLEADWGQWPLGEELTMDAEVAARFDALERKLTDLINHDAGMVIFGDAAGGDPGHTSNLRNVRGDLTAVKAGLTQMQAQLDEMRQKLADLSVAAGDPASVAAELRGVLAQVRVSFTEATTTGVMK